MKTGWSKLFGCSACCACLFATLAPRASAQARPALSVQLFAGRPTLTLTGEVGTVYSIQYANGLSATNLWVDRTLLQAKDASNVSRGFWTGKYLVTQGEYVAVIGSNPSYFAGNLSLPAETVSWFDASNYSAALTQQELAAGRIPTNCVYRLPTEAEWEYACRAGTTTRFSYGDDPSYTSLTNYAWYSDNSDGTTHPVGQKLPNPWGLYDMQGNVWEWCYDWAGLYPGGSVVDPVGGPPGANRILRGAGWFGIAPVCRSAKRQTGTPDDRQYGLGFRVVLASDQP